LAFGFWLLAFGFWLLAFGFWLLALGHQSKSIASKLAPTQPSRQGREWHLGTGHQSADGSPDIARRLSSRCGCGSCASARTRA
jgi:hypothetical protein